MLFQVTIVVAGRHLLERRGLHSLIPCRVTEVYEDRLLSCQKPRRVPDPPNFYYIVYKDESATRARGRALPGPGGRARAVTLTIMRMWGGDIYIYNASTVNTCMRPQVSADQGRRGRARAVGLRRPRAARGPRHRRGGARAGKLPTPASASTPPSLELRIIFH